MIQNSITLYLSVTSSTYYNRREVYHNKFKYTFLINIRSISDKSNKLVALVLIYNVYLFNQYANNKTKLVNNFYIHSRIRFDVSVNSEVNEEQNVRGRITTNLQFSEDLREESRFAVNPQHLGAQSIDDQQASIPEFVFAVLDEERFQRVADLVTHVAVAQIQAR